MVIEFESLANEAVVMVKRSGKKRGRPKKVDNGNRLTSVSKKEPAQKSSIVIDYPKNGEKIHPHHYAIRIGASGGEAGETVEISIDGSEWKPCRAAGGYYWFDWHSISSGEHEIAARIKLPTGKYKKSKIVRVEVA